MQIQLKTLVFKCLCILSVSMHLVYKRTTAGEDIGLGRMDSNATDVVRVGLKHVDTLQGVVVEHSDLHVILRREKKNIES